MGRNCKFPKRSFLSRLAIFLRDSFALVGFVVVLYNACNNTRITEIFKYIVELLKIIINGT